MNLYSMRRRPESWPSTAVLVALFLASIPSSTALAQRDASDIPVVTKAVALEGVRIVQSPGRVIENGTVLIRNGLIEAVGENVDVPYDAERIAPDSMTVYAGFIDGLSSTGVPQPKEEEDLPPVPDRGNPPDDRAGIQPQRDVRSLLSADQKSIENLRKLGFGAAHVVPIGRMLPGSGAVVLLAGDEPRDMVLKGDASLFVQFQGARRMYPGTPMAMTAKFRQLFTEAKRRQQMVQLFESGTSGVPRPEFDEVHYAFFPVIDREKPVFFYVDDVLEIHRALKLQSILGFDLSLAGLHEGFDAVDALASSGAPLFVTLDLPKKPKWMSKLKRDSLETILAAYDDETRTATFRDVEAERRNLEARQVMSRDEFASVAAKLEAAGVSFGFTTRGAKTKDIRKNIREMIDRGLSEDAALAALTTHAAANLGLSESLGSVDVGKIANLIVADGPLFDANTKYQYVFVDGKKFFYEKSERERQTDDDSLAGTWTFTAFTPDGEQSGEVVFEKDGESYTGTITYPDLDVTMELTDVSLDEDHLSFSWEDPNSGTMTVEGSISGDEFEGIVIIGEEEMLVIGVKEDSPE
ncbi:MAG: amidohydrolase family protein [Bacteroidetes bacterium]|nr:amidohydrolase family protein [Bacteroidota bacterium]